jgi:hypothetical protein
MSSPLAGLDILAVRCARATVIPDRHIGPEAQIQSLGVVGVECKAVGETDVFGKRHRLPAFGTIRRPIKGAVEQRPVTTAVVEEYVESNDEIEYTVGAVDELQTLGAC